MTDDEGAMAWVASLLSTWHGMEWKYVYHAVR